MNKNDYIKAIEELNQEQKKFYNSTQYKKYRDKETIKKLLKNKQYIKMFLWVKERNQNKKVTNKRKVYKEENKNQDPNIETKKKVVYTCVLGQYDKIYSPLITTENTEYIIFSDNEDVIQGIDSWQVRKIPEEVRKICKNNKILINRYIKMHPHKFFSDYDYALYIDGNIRIISDLTDVFKKINGQTGLAMHDHPKREDVYEEAEICIKTKKGNKRNIKKQIEKYKKEGFPKQYGLFEATIIAIDLKNNNSKIILEEWWKEFFLTETYRDQLIFTYILWKNKHCFEEIGIIGKNILENPKFVRYMHNYKDKKKQKWRKKIYQRYIKPIHIKKRLKNFGMSNKCNICESYLRKVIQREENNICPVCQSDELERMEFYYIKRYTDLLANRNIVLHIGLKEEIKKKLLKGKTNTYYKGVILQDKLDINFAENSFDYIICNESLKNKEKIILILKNILKPEGKIILLDADENILKKKEDLNLKIRKYHILEEDKKETRKYGIQNQSHIYIITK